MEEIEQTTIAEPRKKITVKEITQPMATILAGALIAGSILIGFSWLKSGNTTLPDKTTTPDSVTAGTVPPLSKDDRVLGDSGAKVTLVEYADFQCPFCGKFQKEVVSTIGDSYVKDGRVQLVYRDYAFLGPESTRAAEAARCAGDQNKFWEYHDYLFSHQNGENQGAFSDPNLKSFAKALGLNETSFNSCLDSSKYAKAVSDSTAEGNTAGVNGTPKGFILVQGKVVSTIDGAEPLTMVTAKLDKALK
jgi:protein-disulfide isomerase